MVLGVVAASLRWIARGGLPILLIVAMLLACDEGGPPRLERATNPPAPTDIATPTSAPSHIATVASPSTDTPELTRTPVPMSTSAPEPALELSIIVATVPSGLPQYDRDDWRHWTDEDGDCQDIRHEVLIMESQLPVTYRSDRKCRVDTGQWFAAFTGITVTDASELDIDHLVPLANAHQSGGWAWTPSQKREYANSLDDPDHLIAVTAGANRAKGAKAPDEWRPPDQSYWCEYALDWIRIKQTWGLTVTPEEAEALREMLGTCANPSSLTTMQGDAPSRPASPTPTSSGQPYASCEEAEEAGEERVQGSSGSGRGFPQAKVPSARDGDGDGVVCER